MDMELSPMNPFPAGGSTASFSYRDLLNGHVNYVQSRHQRMEPTADQMMLCVSDGKRDSAHVPFYIIISPTNDEVPEFIARNITVSPTNQYQPSETTKVSFKGRVTRDRSHNVLLYRTHVTCLCGR